MEEPPLQFGPIPDANDQHCRLKLYNISNNCIKFKDIFLLNQKNVKHSLNQLCIPNGASITIALKKIKYASDLPAVEHLCDLNDPQSKIYLSDQLPNGKKIQLYPRGLPVFFTVQEIQNKFSKCPLVIDEFINNNNYNGYQLHNTIGIGIKLHEFKIINENKSWEIDVPKWVEIDNIYRLIILINENYEPKPNEFIVSIGKIKFPQKLYLMDAEEKLLKIPLVSSLEE